MTAWTQADFERVGDQDADRPTASPLTLRSEFEDGKASAWKATERSAADGHSADVVEQRHWEANGPTADQHERTPAEAAWHRGYDAGADGSTSLLRELEREAG